MLNLIRLVYLCSTTEPGVIPAIQNEAIKELYQKEGRSNVSGAASNTLSQGSDRYAFGIRVEYKTEAERVYDGNKSAYFYCDERFKLQSAV